MKLSDNTSVAMPVRNLLSIVAAVAVGVWAFFGIQERLNTLETRATLADADLLKNTEFRIKWPRGEMGALPADQQQDIEKLIEDVEKLKDKVRENKNGGYDGSH